MKHEQFREWVQLSVVGELSDAMQELLDNHLRECARSLRIISVKEQRNET